ncbi:MAG: hypothetical protein HY002_11685 [Candidatus Rokubacteria bacterium]|nr:hypothetical protein [Candidatus Rokubacteria bacterium]
MPRYFDIRTTVLVAVGHGLLPEEEDRPIAYALRHAINERGRGTDAHVGVVVTDVWMLQNEMAEFFPAIALGGPGANAFTTQIYEELPVAYTRDQRIFIQMDSEGGGKRAAIWGMDHEATREASQIFIADGFLDRFLDLVWRRGGA